MIPAAAAAPRAGARLPSLPISFRGLADRAPWLRRQWVVLALALTVASSGVRAAETLYVIEQLVIAVNSAPGGTGDRVATIKSGDRVEVLDHQGEEVQIQLPSGTSGWVKASYLSAELPLQRRLQDQTAQVE